jgi:ferredoxin-NADP reductase
MSGDGLSDTLHLLVSRFDSEAKDVVVLELRDRLGKLLPSFSPGSHLEVCLPNGLVRHYSLCNDSAERDRYCIGVALPRESRGGARYIHEFVRRGDTVAVSTPRNNFPLVADANAYCFIAGGIGITPLLSMVKWCISHSKSWRLHYCTRSRQRSAFYEEIHMLPSGGDVRFHFDDEQAGRQFNPHEALSDLPDDAHIYCCGPGPLMDAVHGAVRFRPAHHVHFEWFAPQKRQVPPDRHAFTVVVHSTGQRLQVAANESILDVLETHGHAVPSSCREGLCATCQTTVISGIPDHLDSVLSKEQRESNRTMLVCVSRAKSDVIELDL